MPGPNTLMAVALRRPGAAGDAPAPEGPRSRIAVIGDSDFATNSFFHIMGNGALFLNAVNYLAAQENLIACSPAAPTGRAQPHQRQMKALLLSVILVPLCSDSGNAVWGKQLEPARPGLTIVWRSSGATVGSERWRDDHLRAASGGDGPATPASCCRFR